MDIWISRDDDNIQRVVHSLQSFGFVNVTPEMLAVPGQVIRMGVPPLRLELLTSISGVEFEECFAVREEADIDGVRVPLIRLEDLRTNEPADA